MKKLPAQALWKANHMAKDKQGVLLAIGLSFSSFLIAFPTFGECAKNVTVSMLKLQPWPSNSVNARFYVSPFSLAAG
jgi:hypothetical protein